METTYFFNPDIRPIIVIPPDLHYRRGRQLDLFVEYYYITFRAQEAFDGTPPQSLTVIYSKYKLDWYSITQEIERTNGINNFGGGQGPMVERGFMRLLNEIDDNYRAQLHRDSMVQYAKEEYGRYKYANLEPARTEILSDGSAFKSRPMDFDRPL
jgi:hypothetical protein